MGSLTGSVLSFTSPIRNMLCAFCATPDFAGFVSDVSMHSLHVCNGSGMCQFFTDVCITTFCASCPVSAIIVIIHTILVVKSRYIHVSRTSFTLKCRVSLHEMDVGWIE